jgi:dTDP-4-amino-4,6-dideoxygalactose transaminase
MTRIPFLDPTFPDVADIAEDYASILKRRRFSNGGPLESRFAFELAEWIGPEVKVGVVSNATTGLQLAMASAFHRGRQLVLVPSFTFAAGPLAIRWCGYEPAFFDIRADSWQPDLDDAAQLLARAPRQVAGILLTTTFGVANAEVSRWEELARRHDLPLVIDSAAGFGSEYSGGEPLGARGNCEIFSFHATKTLAVGEGGAISSRDHDLIEKIDRLKNFGFDTSGNATACGTNAKLSELASAIGLRQLSVHRERVAQRRELLRRYMKGLEPLGLAFQPMAEFSAVPFVSVALPSSRERDALAEELRVQGVECRAYYNPPIHQHAVFASSIVSGALSSTVDLAARMVSLPMADELASKDIDFIVDVAGSVVGS